MGFVDANYYNSTYHGEPTTDSLTTLIERASDVINSATGFRIPDIDDISSTFIVKQIKNATCAQIEFMDANGGLQALNGGTVQSATVGKFSYSSGSPAGNSSQDVPLAPLALAYLEPTGYLYRGLGKDG